jgi:hypothetical protein
MRSTSPAPTGRLLPIIPDWALRGSATRQAQCDLFATGDFHVPRETQRLQQSYQHKPGIQLEPAKPERRRIWEGMVIVVPSLAPRKQRYHARISAVVIAGNERLRAEAVHQGVYRRHRLLDHEHAYDASPEKPADGAPRASGRKPADHGGDEKTQSHPRIIKAIYRNQRAIRHQVRNVVRNVRIIVLDHPDHMSMQETSQAPENRGAVQVRRVQIAFVVRQFVMPSMHRDPRYHRASPRHRSHDDKNATHDHAG